MSQAIESIKRSINDLERQINNLQTSHEIRKQAIVNASQGVTGSVLFKSLQDLSTEIRQYERELGSLNSKILTQKALLEMMQNKN
jgi:hypothetical protein